MMPVEHRLGVERIHLARAAVHEQLDHRPGARLEVRPARAVLVDDAAVGEGRATLRVERGEGAEGRELQHRAEEFNANQVGRTVRVLVEKTGEARTHMDAPDIDGTVFVDKKLPVGEFADVTIADWRGYDLVAKR